MPPTAHNLEAALRRVRARLRLRRLARAGTSGLAAACGATLAALALFVWVPAWLGLSFVASPLLCSTAGIAMGAWQTMRELRAAPSPGLTEAALGIEARLPGSRAEIITALHLPESSPFTGAVRTRADNALKQALAEPAPYLLSTSAMLAAPVLLLATVTALIWTAQLTPLSPTGELTAGGDRGAPRIDIRTDRQPADAGQAVTAMQTLRSAAAVIRDADATTEKRQGALDDAHRAIDASSGADSDGGARTDALPRTVPDAPAERDELADRLDKIVGDIAAAARVNGDGAGTTDTGRDADFEADLPVERFVAFPRPAAGITTVTARDLAGQTPARRELAARAASELENIRTGE